MYRCVVTGFRETAVLLQERAELIVQATSLEVCRAAVTIGQEGGGDLSLEIVDSHLDSFTVWGGAGRPGRLVEKGCRYVTFSSPKEGHLVNGRLALLE